MHLVGNNSSMQPTQLWSVDKSTSTLLHDVYLQTLFSAHTTCFCYEMLYKMPCPLPNNHFIMLLTSFTYRPTLASPAHLYMPHLPHLFTHCLPTIICVMLMSISIVFSYVFCFFFAICYISLWLHFHFGLLFVLVSFVWLSLKKAGNL